MLEAMDTEIGRLLAGLEALPGNVDENTTILFVGDNGTPKEVTVAPFLPTHAKQTLYEGGVRVPLIAAGYGVRDGGRVSDALINTVDVFATVLELLVGPGYRSHLHTALGDDRPIDAVSFVPILEHRARDTRDFALAETKLIGANGKVIRELERDVDGNAVASYKLLLFATMEGTPGFLGANDFDVTDRELYELLSDPFEHVNLLLDPLDEQAAEAYDRLCGRVRDLCGVDIVCTPDPLERAGRRLAGSPGPSGATALTTSPSLGWDRADNARPANIRIAATPTPSYGNTRMILSGGIEQLQGPGRIAIYDVGGRLLHELWKGESGRVPPELVWDGNNAEGRLIPSGNYLVRLEVDGAALAVGDITLLR